MTTTTFTLTVTGSSEAARIASLLSSKQFSSEIGEYIGVSSINSLVPARGEAGVANFQPFYAPNEGANTKTLMYWTGKAQWDGTYWWYCAGTTGRYPGSLSMVRYDPVSDTFRHWQGDDYLDATNSVFGVWGAPHNFGGACFGGGKIYRDLPAYLGGPGYRGLGIWGTATQTGRVVQQAAGLGSYWLSAEFFPEMGDSGTVVLFPNGGTGLNFGFRRFDVALDDWTSTISQPNFLEGPACIYHDGYLYYTDGSSSRQFFRMSPSGAISALAQTPVTMNGRSDVEATHAILLSLGAYIYAFVNRTVYQFDPATLQWTSGAYDSFPWDTPGENQHFTVGPLPDLGVALLVRNLSSGNEAVLWKP